MKALTNSPRLGIVQYCLLFFTHGLTYGFFAISLPAFLVEHGVSPGWIATLLVMIGLPWALRMIGGPIVDRLTFFAMGRRRTWIVFAHLIRTLILVSFLFLSHLPTQLTELSILFFLFSTASAFQFTAIDAQMIELNLPEHYNRLSGYTSAAFLVGLVVGAAGIGTLLTYHDQGWLPSNLVLLGIFTMIGIFILFLREDDSNHYVSFKRMQDHEINPAFPSRSFKEIFVSLWQTSKQTVYLILMFYLLVGAIPSGITYALAPILAVKDFHWTDQFYSQVIGVVYPVAGILASILSGWIATRKGSMWLLIIATILYSIILMTMAFLHSYWQYSALINVLIMITFVSTFAAVDTAIKVASFALMMQLTTKQIVGTQFSLLISISNLSIIIGNALFGIIQHWINNQEILIVTSIINLFAIIILLWLKFNQPMQHPKT